MCASAQTRDGEPADIVVVSTEPALVSIATAGSAKSLPGPLPVDHWDTLFEAVTTTLRQACDKPRHGVTEWPARETTLKECVRQLELLHHALRDERRRADASLRMVAALQEALAVARTGSGYAFSEEHAQVWARWAESAADESAG